jgi:hypothetical protein
MLAYGVFLQIPYYILFVEEFQKCVLILTQNSAGSGAID